MGPPSNPPDAESMQMSSRGSATQPVLPSQKREAPLILGDSKPEPSIPFEKRKLEEQETLSPDQQKRKGRPLDLSSKKKPRLGSNLNLVSGASSKDTNASAEISFARCPTPDTRPAQAFKAAEPYARQNIPPIGSTVRVDPDELLLSSLSVSKHVEPLLNTGKLFRETSHQSAEPGIFDDAESDSGEPVKAVKEAFLSNSKETQTGKIETKTTSPSTKGGIFDDAELDFNNTSPALAAFESRRMVSSRVELRHKEEQGTLTTAGHTWKQSREAPSENFDARVANQGEKDILCPSLRAFDESVKIGGAIPPPTNTGNAAEISAQNRDSDSQPTKTKETDLQARNTGTAAGSSAKTGSDETIPSEPCSSIAILPDTNESAGTSTSCIKAGAQSVKIKQASGVPAVPNIVEAGKKKVKVKKKAVKSPDKSLSSQELSAKPKKQAKATKRVLVAKKEKNMATSLLAGKVDLSQILPIDHCHFLAKYWIFTLQQLEYVLRPTSSEPVGNPGHQESESNTMNKPNDKATLRLDLFQAVAQSNLMSSEGEQQKGERSSVANKQHPSPAEGERNEARAKAENVLRVWQGKVEAWKAQGQGRPVVQLEKSFLLDGAVKILFPICVQRFLASVPIKTLYDFLSLKKTETGAIIAYCVHWRKKSGLPDATPLALAKLFLGIGFRIETAISSTAPADKRTRSWAGDPLIVLTGSAREFVVEHRRIDRGKVFLETRTKDLADSLEEWRKVKGLPPLKGSGKVAMISSWKALVKEAVDIEEGKGKIFKDINFQACLEESEAKTLPKQEKKAPQPEKRTSQEEFTFDPTIPDVDAALHSAKFLKEVLDPKHFSVLKAAGIRTAIDLFAAQKKEGSPLANEVSKLLPDPKICDTSLVIFDWCQIVRKRLSGIRRVKKKRKVSPPEQANASISDEKTEKFSQSKKETAPRPTKKDLASLDPFYSLSAVTQTFLGTLGISTAEEFMTTRTTDLASKFVEWREKRNMSVLKGLGSIASVSGWKAQIRKMARERGLHDLALLGPGGVTQEAAPDKEPLKKAVMGDDKVKKPASGTKAEQHSLFNKQGRIPTGSTEKISRPDLLFGKSTKRFAAASTGDHRLQFLFELALRSVGSGCSGPALFLTLSGAMRLRGTSIAVSSPVFVREVGFEKGPVTMQVVRDVSAEMRNNGKENAGTRLVRTPFNSVDHGLINLSRYNVFPTPYRGEVDSIFYVVEGFILGRRQALRWGEVFSSNVVVRKDENGRCQYLLCVSEPLQQGQVLRVDFFSLKNGKSTAATIEQSNGRNHFYGQIFARLSREGLQVLVEKVSLLIRNKIDKKLGILPDESDKTVTDPSELEKLVLARRRAHWVVIGVISELQERDKRNVGTRKAAAVSFDQSNESDALWTNRLTAKLKSHPAWNERVETALMDEVRTEFECAAECDVFLNSLSRKRWCTAAVSLFTEVSKHLVHLNARLDDSYSEDAALRDMQYQLTKAIQKLLQAKENPNGFEQVTIRSFTKGWAGLGPAVSQDDVFQASVLQSYHDAMSLCDEDFVDVAAPEELYVVAAFSNWDTSEPADSQIVTFRTSRDVERGYANLCLGWYVQNQIALVLISILSCFPTVLPNGFFEEMATKAIEQSLEKSMRGEADVPKLQGTPITLPSSVGPSLSQPHSLPLFLQVVWPVLQNLHWRVEGGESPSDVVFLPPGQRSRFQTSEKQSRGVKQGSTKSRIRLSKAVNDIGLGYIPKFTKRLFANVMQAKTIEAKALKQNARIPVSLALDRFLLKVAGDITDENEKTLRRAEQIVEYVRSAFDELFEKLCTDEETQETNARRPSECVGCEYLVRFLLVLPSVLRQGCLSIKAVEDTTMVVKELAEFLTERHRDLFEEKHHLPKETYVEERSVPSNLASRLVEPFSHTSGADDDSESDDLEVILESDRTDLTDFVEVVMSQTVPCRATQEDIARRNRRIGVGYLGLTCKHCLGERGEGRYFFSSIESITTASTVIEKHIQKCNLTPPEIKARMVQARAIHADQRKTLSQGAQASYFLRLWERLRSSKARCQSARMQVLSLNETEDVAEEDETTSLDFDNHLRLIDFISKTSPWCEKPDVIQALAKYYEALEFGGRIYQTQAMPRAFSAEWLLDHISSLEPEPNSV